VFVLVTQRPEFMDKWQAALRPRGAVDSVASLPGLQDLLQRQGPAAVIVDHALVAEATPGFLQVLRRLCGAAQLLVGDASFDAEQELLALAAGVAACCQATMAPDELDRVIDIVLAGGLWLSQSAMPALAEKLHAKMVAAAVPATALDGLTGRQRDVAELVAQGASNKVIARTLNITDRTVKAHLTTVFEKLGLTDRLQLALYVTNRNKAQ